MKKSLDELQDLMQLVWVGSSRGFKKDKSELWGVGGIIVADIKT